MAVKDDDDDNAPAAPVQKDAPVKLEHDKPNKAPARAPSMAKPAKGSEVGAGAIAPIAGGVGSSAAAVRGRAGRSKS